MKLITILKKQYPYIESQSKRFWTCVAFGTFVGLFLLIFQPFDISEINHNFKTLFILGFGIVTFLSLLITTFLIPFFLKKHYQIENWTIGKEIIHVSLTILFITIFNIIYSILFCTDCEPFHEGLFEVFIFSFISVLLVGLIPVTFLTIFYQNIVLKKHIKNAEFVNQNLKEKTPEDKNITIYSNTKKNMVSINSSQLIAIEANGNYINVFYKENDKLNREVIRNTLKKTEKIIENNPNFIRCHKSYIVNLLNLKKVLGNAQGYKLIYDKLDFQIPVSRNLSKKILEKIQK